MSVEEFSFEPTSGFDLPRFAGVPTFMRLPHVDLSSSRAADVEIGLVGVPWDGGTTNRPGARHGPRQIRDLSTMIRASHPTSGRSPFAARRCADLGDAPVNPADVRDSLERIEGFFRDVVSRKIAPLSAGGDHLISLPILRALASASDAPLGMIQFDAHTDLFAGYFGGFGLTHGTPFRRAVEEGVLDPKRLVQIGIRGTMYDDEDVRWGVERGATILRIEEVFERGVADVMREARDVVGDEPCYATFDVDSLDPSFAPGTGTPEIGGFSTFDAQRMIRMLSGLHLVGADVVEVSPPFDPSGGTAWVGASMMFELLDVLASSPRFA